MSQPLLLLVLFLGLFNLAYGAYAFGTYQRLFSAQSLWNSRPISPVFDATARVPESDYYPAIGPGDYSTGVYLAQTTDPAVSVYPLSGYSGVWNVDAFEYQATIQVARWPADAQGAAGSDGHCDIVDPVAGVVHSFWQLKKDGTTWKARQYAWSPLNGLGFGNPAHFYQGARAAGVPSSAGLIRKHEVNDGAPYYNHALALSLTYNGLDNSPTYIYPATSADGDAASTNTGAIPEGALLMLPSDFNTSTITSLQLRKICETLKLFGAYVVDRNYGTPYYIYVENNSSFKLSNKTGWDNTVAAELQRVRAALRYVRSAQKWIDGNGAALNLPTYVNVLSMRGPNSWGRVYGDATLKYDTLSQSLVYSGNNTQATAHENWSGLGYNKVSWGTLRANKPYRFYVEASGGAQIMLLIYNGSTSIANSGFLGNGQGYNFQYTSGTYFVLRALKPAGGAGKVRGLLVYNYVATVPYLGNNTQLP